MSSNNTNRVETSRWNYIYALCAALNSLNLGYDIGVTTDVGSLVSTYFHLTVFQREIFTAGIDFFAIFGACASYMLSDKFGRKANFSSSAILFLVGIALQATAPSYWLLIVGRAFLGFAVGIGFAVDPVYIAEISVKENRGFLVSFSEIATNVGIVFGFSASLIFASIDESIRWRVMVAVGAIAPVCMLFIVTFVMPESPRWLLANNREKEAREVLAKIYTNPNDIDPIVEEIKLALEFDKEARKSSWSDLLFRAPPSVRRMLLVGVGAGIGQQVIGVDAIQYYLNTCIAAVGIPEGSMALNAILLALMILKLICTTTGGYLFDRTGRRPLIFVSLLGCFVGMVVVSTAFFVDAVKPNAPTVIVGIVVYLVFFSFGMGPGSWLIPSEVFATSIRAKSMSLMTSLNRFVAFLYDVSFLSTANAMGWGPFYLMLAIICLIMFAYMYILLPETKGKSLEEMNVYFAKITGDDTTIKKEEELRRKALQNRVLVDTLTTSTEVDERYDTSSDSETA